MRFIPTIHEPVYPPDDGFKVHPWTPRELQVIRERYISEGIRACMRLLPARSQGAILNKAKELGLSRQKPHDKAAPSNDIIDASLRRLYSEPMGKGELKEWCQTYNRTRQWAYRRARELGLQLHLRTGDKWTAWTKEELDFIEDRATLTPESISKAMRRAGFNRTPGAIACKLWKMGIDRQDPDKMSGNELARLMGVRDSHTVKRWIEKEGLKARFIDNGHRGEYEIHRHDVREWMIRSGSWDHRRVNREFLIETLAGRVGLSVSEAIA